MKNIHLFFIFLLSFFSTPVIYSQDSQSSKIRYSFADGELVMTKGWLEAASSSGQTIYFSTWEDLIKKTGFFKMPNVIDTSGCILISSERDFQSQMPEQMLALTFCPEFLDVKLRIFQKESGYTTPILSNVSLREVIQSLEYTFSGGPEGIYSKPHQIIAFSGSLF